VDVEERHESGHDEQQGRSPDREGGSSMEGAPRLVVEIRPRARSMAAGFWAHSRGERRWSNLKRTPGSYNPMVGHPNGTGEIAEVVSPARLRTQRRWSPTSGIRPAANSTARGSARKSRACCAVAAGAARPVEGRRRS
jgi:hypothetical protein